MKTFKVLTIVSEKSILVNYGKEDGAKVGDGLRIVSVGEMIIDPDTKEELGTFDYIKEELEVVFVYPKFSMCSKIAHAKKTNALATLMSKEVSYTAASQIQSLKIDKSECLNIEWQRDPVIHVGDTVTLL